MCVRVIKLTIRCHESSTPRRDGVRVAVMKRCGRPCIGAVCYVDMFGLRFDFVGVRPTSVCSLSDVPDWLSALQR